MPRTPGRRVANRARRRAAILPRRDPRRRCLLPPRKGEPPRRPNQAHGGHEAPPATPARLPWRPARPMVDCTWTLEGTTGRWASEWRAPYVRDPYNPRLVMEDILRYIDTHAETFIHDLQRLCRQPSISAQGVGVEECAALLVAQMQARGIPARIEPISGGPPLVIATIPGASTRTLLLYNHYDVQPTDPLDEWTSDPFGAEIRDGRLYARGAVDTKGNIMARLAALEAWLRARGRLPVTVKFLIEGEEETGSVHLGAAITAP